MAEQPAEIVLTPVQAKRSDKPNDSPHVLVVNCPQCGRRFGVYEAAAVGCTCGKRLAVMPFDGWTPLPKPAPLPMNEVAPETLAQQGG